MENLDDILGELEGIGPSSQKQEEKAKDEYYSKSYDKVQDFLKYKDYSQDISLKRMFADQVLRITNLWVSFLIGIFVATGVVNFLFFQPVLSDAVLIALISGTSLSVIIGMVSIILKYLFTFRR